MDSQKMDNYNMNKMGYLDIKLKKHIVQFMDKVNDNKYWDKYICKDALLNSFNYFCIFYVIVHYEIFSYDICKNYECRYCCNKSSNVIFDYNSRRKIIVNILINHREKNISLNKFILEFLIELIKKLKQFNFCCSSCKRKDYPILRSNGYSENQIINLVYRIRLNKNSNKWKNHRVKIQGTKIINISS